jgi:L-threonylcarbamoyladenylate synthase
VNRTGNRAPERRELARWRFGESFDLPRSVVAAGGVLVIPTESSYGLGADPRNRAAVEAVYRLKGRDAGKPLPVVVAVAGDAVLVGVDPGSPELARAAACWPAALTVVLPLAVGAPALPAAAGARTVAVRVPDHEPLRRLLAAVGPLTATSANPSGGAPVVDPDELAALFAAAPGDTPAPLLVDGGVLPGGPPSTLVAFGAGGGVRVLRPGPVEVHRLDPGRRGGGREGSPGRGG